ncbi:MAG: hypothetical protein COV48_10535 [Elusimicrobia bacterium CG11_big_fil_rev_8_21_14_0_20_64_6]|nr:MAG: hypothetical protein COV48_10535 [Elusimicrobia bacterium CG11_big_fil_rev_8_21_14_0_20_64_6]
MKKIIAHSRAAPATSWLVALFFGVSNANALSLRSAAAETFLGDVRPGSVVVLSSAARTAPSVENAGGEPVEVFVTWEVPPPERLRDGFDPLPELKWVVMKGESWTLSPGQKAEPRVSVHIPKGRRLEGAQYQFDCVFRARSPGGSKATLRTAVLLAVGEGSAGDVPQSGVEGSLLVSPSKGHLDDVPIGKRQSASSKTFRALKLANVGESEAVVRLTPMRAWDESLRIEDGYSPAPNPNWLKAGPPVRVPAGEFAQTSFKLEIPRQTRYRGRKWVFVVAIDAEQDGRLSRRWWTLYVRTQDAEDERER